MEVDFRLIYVFHVEVHVLKDELFSVEDDEFFAYEIVCVIVGQELVLFVSLLAEHEHLFVHHVALYLVTVLDLLGNLELDWVEVNQLVVVLHLYYIFSIEIHGVELVVQVREQQRLKVFVLVPLPFSSLYRQVQLFPSVAPNHYVFLLVLLLGLFLDKARELLSLVREGIIIIRWRGFLVLFWTLRLLFGVIPVLLLSGLLFLVGIIQIHLFFLRLLL